MLRLKIVTLTLILSLICGMQALAKGHPFSVHDMLAMKRVSDPHASPDGQQVVFTYSTIDLDANRSRTDLWLVGVDGSGLRKLTAHPEDDFNPRWSADGRNVYFLSTRSGSSQVWRIAVDGGEAEQVTDQPLDIAALAVSPTGTHLGLVMEVFPGTTIAETKRHLVDTSKQRSTGRIYDKLFIRHWDTWKDGRRRHIVVVSTEGDDAVDLMKAMDADCPSKPFGGPEELTFTPDGQSVVFAARDVGRIEPWSTNFDLYIAPITGHTKPRSLTEHNLAWDTQPAFSPDGKTLAYLAMSRAGYESDRFEIMLQDWPDGANRSLTKNWDRSAGSLAWSKDSKVIFTTATNLGQHSLFSINVDNGKVRTLVQDGHVSSPTVANQHLVLGIDNLRSPAELFSVSLTGGDVSAITQINKDAIGSAKMGEYQQFTFKGWNNEDVHAYVVKPIDFNARKKYPVAFLIHGGPQGSFGNHFHYRWNPQVYAGAGYAAVMVDFHGSTGYGQAFCDSIRGDWGGKPLEDLQKGLAAALERNPWMDGDRVVALGASFGGFMINWIAGNWPDRFKCLVNHDGNLDERMAYYDTEELWFPEWDHQGTPWSNPDGYTRHNPIDFVKNWKTPMLVIHSGHDYRVVDTQGMATFTALQRRGIPSKFLYFPDESHWVLKPHNSILWHNTVLAWINRWAKQ